MADLCRTLQLSEIRSLALEGGGGKRFAFLGAPDALEPLGGLEFSKHRTVGRIRGFSSSSAGAITALLLSCGYSPSYISVLVEQVDFSKLFDDLQRGRKLRVFGSKRESYGPTIGTEPEPPAKAEHRQARIRATYLAKGGLDLAAATGLHAGVWVALALLGKSIGNGLRHLSYCLRNAPSSRSRRSGLGRVFVK